MKDQIFYVCPQIGRTNEGQIIPDKNVAIPAKYLIVNGKPVIDPNADGSSQTNLYHRLDASGRIDESTKFSNTNNFLIVPANYSPLEAIGFAGDVDIGMGAATAFGGPLAGGAVGAGAMTNAFLPGHDQDLQRGERWGIPAGERSPAFKDSASWNFGYVTQMTALPNGAAVVGGAALNDAEYGKAWAKEHVFNSRAPTQKLNGALGMSKSDYNAFLSGVSSAKETQQSAIADAAADIVHEITSLSNPNYTPSARQTILNRLRGGQGASTYTPVPGQSPVDQLRAHKAQAQNAPAQPLSPAMQARQAILRTLPTQMPSFAPIPGGGTYTHPPRGRAADLMMDAAGANTLPRQLTAALEQAAHAGTPLTPDDVQKLARQLSAANPQHPMLREVASGPALAAARQALIAAAGASSAGTISASALAPGARNFTQSASSAARQTGLSMAAGNAAAAPTSFETPTSLAPTPLGPTNSAQSGFPLYETAANTARSQRAFEDAIAAFFTRQARLPPNAGAAFDPLCTPAWPAWKFPA